MESTLYCLIGMPASGKSTWAVKNASDKRIWISSDDLREELYGDVNNMIHNEEIYRVMEKSAKESLEKGLDVIYDATNINMKKRKELLEKFKGIKKIAIYFATDIDKCLLRNKLRGRHVSENVIINMYKSFQIPMYHEGWDVIKIERELNKNIKKKIEIKNLNYEEYTDFLRKRFKNCIDLAQDNPHHSFSVSRHMYFAYKYVIENSKDENLIMAAMLHDVGKPYCKKFKERYASFIGHENVSAQLAISYLVDNFQYDSDKFIDIGTLIQLHMKFLNFSENLKAQAKFFKEVGPNIYNRLETLYVGDSKAK